MKTRSSNLTITLCWLWVAAVSLYFAWAAYSYSGLYKWLADMQIARWGSYYPEWTAIVPAFLLAAPALSHIGRVSRERRAAGEQGPATQARQTGKVARVTAMFGVAAALVCAGALYFSQSVPDGSEAAVPVDLASLEPGNAPRDKVSILGEVDPDVFTGVTETSRNYDRNTLYVAFVPKGGTKSGPVKLFVERYVGDASGAAVQQVFLPEQTGYLVENGLPPIAVSDLKARGVQVAATHYLLKPGDDARVTPYYVVAGVAGLLAFICLLVALVGWAQSRRTARG